MIKRTLRENANTIARLSPRPKRALEVGALPTEFCVLSTAEARDIPERIGVNISEKGTAPGGVEIVLGDARELPFEDGYFDLVVSASMLEHVPNFWVAVSEMHRVLAPGGFLFLSTPGYRNLPKEGALHAAAFKLHLPDVLRRGTITMRVHDSRDYYRFGEDAYREVLMAGLDDVRVWSIMVPPRIYATGIKPRA